MAVDGHGQATGAADLPWLPTTWGPPHLSPCSHTRELERDGAMRGPPEGPRQWGLQGVWEDRPGQQDPSGSQAPGGLRRAGRGGGGLKGDEERSKKRENEHGRGGLQGTSHRESLVTSAVTSPEAPGGRGWPTGVPSLRSPTCTRPAHGHSSSHGRVCHQRPPPSLLEWPNSPP